MKIKPQACRVFDIRWSVPFKRHQTGKFDHKSFFLQISRIFSDHFFIHSKISIRHINFVPTFRVFSTDCSVRPPRMFRDRSRAITGSKVPFNRLWTVKFDRNRFLRICRKILLQSNSELRLTYFFYTLHKINLFPSRKKMKNRFS